MAAGFSRWRAYGPLYPASSIPSGARGLEAGLVPLSRLRGRRALRPTGSGLFTVWGILHEHEILRPDYFAISYRS